MEKHIDINRLTSEAEAGHGKFVQSALKDVPFDEQIKILREVASKSKEHHKSTADPLVTYDPWARNCGDVTIMLKLTTKWSGPEWLGIDNNQSIYTNVLDITTGKQTTTVSDSQK